MRQLYSGVIKIIQRKYETSILSKNFIQIKIEFSNLNTHPGCSLESRPVSLLRRTFVV